MRQAQQNREGSKSEVEALREGLDRLARQQLDWFRFLAVKLEDQEKALAELRVELKRQRVH